MTTNNRADRFTWAEEPMPLQEALTHLSSEDLDALHKMAEAECLVDDDGPDEPPVVDPVAAYADGYQQGVDLGWPSEDHIGTEPFELGYIDGVDRRLGDAPDAEEIRYRLIDWGIIDAG